MLTTVGGNVRIEYICRAMHTPSRPFSLITRICNFVNESKFSSVLLFGRPSTGFSEERMRKTQSLIEKRIDSVPTPL